MPNIFDIHCLSHGAALANKSVSKKYPTEILNMITQINTWFSHSPKEQ